VVLVLETTITEELTEEWWTREVMAAVNGLRGDRALPYEARIRLDVWCGPNLRSALEKNIDTLKGETLSSEVRFRGTEEPGGAVEAEAGVEAFRIELEVRA
jgi:hypothetical protein